MFKSFYGLTLNPFDKSLAVKHAFNSKDHKNMLDRLNYFYKRLEVWVFSPHLLAWVRPTLCAVLRILSIRT